MPGPIESTGAQRNPTRYGTLTQAGREITGMWTNRNPLRDAAVPYLVGKFYGGSRFDSINDGINREITVQMTDKRAPGSIVFNNNTFPGCLSFYPWKYIQNGAEIVRTVYDGFDGHIYDATPGQKSTLFSKMTSAPARFLGVNTSLFFGDGVDTNKILRSAKVWAATTLFNVNDFIVDPNQNIQLVRANPVNATITNISVQVSLTTTLTYLVVTFSAAAPAIAPNWTASFSGLTTYVALNGQTLVWNRLPQAVLQDLNLNTNQIAFQFAAAPYGPAVDTGTMVALTQNQAVSGGAQPAWNAATGGTTADGSLIWTNMGPAVENWGLAGAPYAAPDYNFTSGVNPFVQAQGKVRYWRPALTIPANSYYAVIDANANIQIAHNATGSAISNNATASLPNWSPQVGGATVDGPVTWICYGPLGSWYAGNDYGGANSGVANPCVILDPNGNLQFTDNVTTARTSSAGPLAWVTTIGATTADGPITWTCAGPGIVLWSGTYQYSFSYEGIDGSVSTAQPITLVANGGLGINGGFQLKIIGPNTPDPQCKNIIIWRTPQGQSTLIFADRIPNPSIGTGGSWTYFDVLRDTDLNPFIIAPVAHANDVPDPTMTAPEYHMQRVFAIVGNKVVWSGGPDTLARNAGNGNTAFPPENFIAYPAQPIRLFPVTVQNGGLIVGTTDGFYIILGTGTASNPFYTTSWLATVSMSGYTAADVYNNAIFLMEANKRVSALAIEYPFNPQSGYTEIGFPVGDQFVKVTTGGLNASLYAPSTAYLSWNVQSTGENAMYVADGSVGWFRMGIIMPPESGFVWMPRRAITGGTSAVQSVETSPGVSQLLIGPPNGNPGPILARDDSGAIFNDDGTAYPAWDARGVILMCSTGQWVDIAHVATKSRAVGARPVISMLLGELVAATLRPWDPLNLVTKSNDPANLRASLSMFSDRYTAQQNGALIQGDALSVKFDYGTQDAGDELLDWGIFTSLHDERQEEAASVGR